MEAIQASVTKQQQETEDDLAKAEPALQAANTALNTLNRVVNPKKLSLPHFVIDAFIKCHVVNKSFDVFQFKNAKDEVTSICVHVCLCDPVESDRAQDFSQPSSYCRQRLGSCSGPAVPSGPNPQRSQLEGLQDGYEQGEALHDVLQAKTYKRASGDSY